jgi:hypothetical protein
LNKINVPLKRTSPAPKEISTGLLVSFSAQGYVGFAEFEVMVRALTK